MYLEKIKVEDIHRCTKIRFRAKPSTDISHTLPYLNSIYPNSVYRKEIPSLELPKDGALILLQGEEIHLHELNNTSHGIKIIDWLKEEINRVHDNKSQIEPDYTMQIKLSVPELYQNLPQLNCGKCGEDTCFAFATLFIRGEYELQDCPPLFEEKHQKLKEKLLQIYF